MFALFGEGIVTLPGCCWSVVDEVDAVLIAAAAPGTFPAAEKIGRYCMDDEDEEGVSPAAALPRPARKKQKVKAYHHHLHFGGFRISDLARAPLLSSPDSIYSLSLSLLSIELQGWLSRDRSTYSLRGNEEKKPFVMFYPA